MRYPSEKGSHDVGGGPGTSVLGPMVGGRDYVVGVAAPRQRRGGSVSSATA